MPQMGVSVAEGTIVSWRKRAGDWVEMDEPIVEISTDKVETEIPSPAAGRVSEVLVEAGVTVDVGTPLAKIDTGARPGEPHADEGAPQAGQAIAEESAVEAGPIDTPAEPAADRAETLHPSGGNGGARPEHGPPISPVVRRIADEHGIDLSQVEGSGRRGRVTKKDVMAYLERSPAPSPEPPEVAARPEPALHIESPYREESPAPSPQSPGIAAGGELSVMRRQIGEHMLRSLQTAAHCTTIVEADMSRIEVARSAGPRKLTYLPFVARCAIDALREFPTLNATFEGERFTVHEEINLGIAVSLGENGLIVPVIRNAHELSAEGLAVRIKDLAERARSKRLSPDEVTGGTFTITNPGAFGALLATPIINQPQVAILDLEAVVKRPVVVGGEGGDAIAIRPMTYFCMSWDHRALDGALAAQFLSAVRRRVESFGG
jgi:pyruvate/2-oxoglutarate dehydrogenase complex dihydrolipoamide acyltransferase (E2) component